MIGAWGEPLQLVGRDPRLGAEPLHLFGVARDQNQRDRMLEALLFGCFFIIAALGPDTYRRWRYPVTF